MAPRRALAAPDTRDQHDQAASQRRRDRRLRRGGGIPVIRSAAGELCGAEAVIDKDHAAALLAEALETDVMLLLTDVPAVWTRWPMSAGRPIARTTPMELRTFTFAAGSMGPNVEAACRFVERTGRVAAIGAIDQAEAIVEGAAGTVVQAS
jgi:carbamate kinase